MCVSAGVFDYCYIYIKAPVLFLKPMQPEKLYGSQRHWTDKIQLRMTSSL